VEAKPLGAVALDVIISEVAWGGTAGNSSYEWIELYNTTGSPITMLNWTLVALDGAPSISSISGIIPAYGYFLLENNQDATTLPADKLYSGTLSNTNETLTLKEGAAIIDTANAGCSGCWYAGSGSPDYFTMQRVGTTPDGSAAWVSGIATPRNSQIDLALSMNFVSSTGTTPPYDVTFAINLRNKGFGTAVNVQTQNTLLASLGFISASASIGSYNSATGIWDIPSISSGSEENLTITATMTGAGPDTVSATITQSEISSGTPISDPNTSDNSDAIKIGSTVLSITNSVNNPTPNIGSNVVFNITVTNPNADETGVSVDALLPSGILYISHSSTLGTTYNNNTGVWTIGPLLSGASVSLSITAQVLSPLTMMLVADVSSDNFGNNSAIATITPIPSTQADLKLVQSRARSTTAAGTAILTLTVTNEDATNVATNVQVRDLLPSGLTYVAHTSGMNYISSTGIWAVGTILGASSVSLSITVKVSPSGTSTTNFAEIWLSDQFDIDSTPGNGDVAEDDSVSSEVLVADLSVTQTSNIAASNAVFTIKVTNSGPDDATNVQVNNTKLHTSYAYVSASVPAGTSYNSTTGIWAVNSLASGTTATLIVTTTVITPDENWAEVSAVTEVDPDSLPANGSQTEDDDAATPSADLSLTQVILSPAPYLNSDINSTVTFRITVSNAGYANATGVEVKDLLPAGLTYVSHTSGQTYNSSSGIWSIGSLLSGQSVFLDITAKVVKYGIRTNWAEVWKSTQSDPDSNPGDGSTIEDDDASVTITSYRSVIFNEIAWAGTTASVEDEWIELYNPSDSEIIITGWQIKKNSCSGAVYITLSGKVSKDNYFLLERGDTSTDNTTVSDISAGQIYLAAATPALLDAGETLYLCDNFGNFIDTANVNGGNWPAGGNSTNRPSMERLTSSTEQDSSWGTNNGTTKNGLNASGGSIYGTPGKKNSTGDSSSSASPTKTPIPTSTPVPTKIVLPPRPILNEILARPGFDWNQDGAVNVFDEFIEIKNLTAIDISLRGWKLDVLGRTPFILPDITLKPGERIIYYSKETNLLLSDGGATVRLMDPGGKIYDAFTYTLARAEDRSFCRLPDGTPGNSWFEDCTPTPLLTNTREGKSPTSPNGAQSPVCNLPDTIPLDFFNPECRGYGADIWNPYYWDKLSGDFKRWISGETGKWDSFIE